MNSFVKVVKNMKVEVSDINYPVGVTKVPKGKLGKEIPKVNCPLGKDGKPSLMPHETDCRKFYSCNKGFPHLLACQSGLHFNPKLQACDYPENAGCETGVPKKEPKGKVIKDDISVVCSSVSKGKTVMVPHPGDCSKFVVCDSGAAHQKSCPAGLHFSTALQACDYPSKVQCDKMGVLRSVGVPSAFCPEVNGKIAIFYRHASNCSVYYLCSNGLAYEFVCPAGLHFNLRQKKCDYEDNARCPI
ncbi:Peritrophin-1, partial [Araneus ventricosus]